MKYPLRTVLAFLFALSPLLIAPAQDFSPSPPPKQLSLGQKLGTFAYAYSGQVRFTQEPAFPVSVIIADMLRKPLAQTQVKDGTAFIVSAELPPGSYEVISNLAPENSKLYWVALGPSVFIDQNGLATYARGNGSLLHQKMMSVVSPDPKGLETITELRPLLKWRPLKGADHYRITWYVHTPGEKNDPRENGSQDSITSTEFRFPRDVISNRRYEWSVDAMDADNHMLGYWSAAYFFTPGGQEAFQKESPTISAKPGAPYFGIMPMPVPSRTGTQSGGIDVRGVLPNSPALKAGLKPDDILTSFNGHSLEGVSVSEFIGFVQQVTVGTTVTVEFLRQNEQKSIQVTIEAKP